jgi:hypothetical protein
LVAVDAKTDAKTFVITPNASPQAAPDAAGPGVPHPGNSIEADAPAVKLRLGGVGTAPSNAPVAALVPKAVESSVSGTAIPSDSDALTPPVVQPFTVGVPAAGTVAGAVNQSPTGPAFAAYSAAEKIAVVSPGIADVSTMRKAGAIKTVLAADGKSVTASSPRIGIDVATGSPAMPSGSLLDHATDHVAPTAPVAAEVRSDPSLPQMVALPSTAHRAVEAVLSAAERFAARDQHSVNLQFSVGGSDLNVRVELRGNEVHTTFRTDSADLRAALASEWRAVSGSEERSTKLATPVFTTSSGSNDSFSGDESRRQPAAGRDQQPAAWFSGNRAGSGSTATNNSSAAASATTTVAVNSRHLHTLA